MNIDTVGEVRDALGLPERFRSISDMSKEDLSQIATSVCEDSLTAITPQELDPTITEIESVLEAW